MVGTRGHPAHVPEHDARVGCGCGTMSGTDPRRCWPGTPARRVGCAELGDDDMQGPFHGFILGFGPGPVREEARVDHEPVHAARDGPRRGLARRAPRGPPRQSRR